MNPPSLQIDFERLQRDILTLSEIGRSEDRGIYRMAFNDADMEAKKWLMARLAEADISARLDGAANVLAKVGGGEEKPGVLMGSHMDTVPGGGHLDGALGVLVGLECLRRVRESGIQTGYPVELAAFSDEEGRFGGMLGSQAVCGKLNPDLLLSCTDLNGVKLSEAMASHGLDPMKALTARRSPATLHAYLELHIEQGPVLDRLKFPVGVVESITGLFKWSVRLIGKANHAGTTPMNMRNDAFGGLAEFSDEIPRLLEEHGGEGSVATIGRVELHPGAANTIPGQVEFSLDVRDTDSNILDGLADAFRRTLSVIARRRGLMFEFDQLSRIEPAQCHPDIVCAVAETAEALGIKAHRMHSGAAHDAQMMAGITRMGMIFVPSVEGRSHAAAEWTHWEDIETGANLALNTLLRLAEAEA